MIENTILKGAMGRKMAVITMVTAGSKANVVTAGAAKENAKEGRMTLTQLLPLAIAVVVTRCRPPVPSPH